MAQVTINIPDDQVPRVLAAFTTRFGWDPEVDTRTQAQFTKDQVVDFVKRTVRQYEEGLAEQAARAAVPAVTDVDVTG